VLVSLADVSELEGINGSDDLDVGANTTILDLSRNEIVGCRFEALKEACNAFSTVPVMAMGTVGGNLCNASPAGDSAPALIAFGAQVKLVSSRGERVLDLEAFQVGPGKTALEEGEIMHSVKLPATASNTGSAFIKVSRVVADISQVSIAVKIVRDGDKVADCRIALGSVAPTTLRARAAEERLIGKKLDLATLEEVARTVADEVRPITDVRATKEYRRTVSGVIAADALKIAWERAGGGAIQ
jgi:carbon-monoxide dehydrogenase medium subunit